MGIPLAALAVRQPPTFYDQEEQRLGIQAREQGLQLGQQQIQGAQLANQQAQYQFGATQAMNEAYKGAVKIDENGQPQFDTQALTKSLSNAGYGSEVPTILKHITDFQKSQADLVKTNTDVAKTQQEMKVQQSDMLGSVGAAIKAANYDPGFADTFLQHFEANNPQQKPQVDQFRQQLQQNPGIVKQLADQWIAGSPKQQQMENERQIANIRATGGAENRELNAALQSGKIKDESEWPAYKAQLEAGVQLNKSVAEATNPQIQGAKIKVANAEAAGRAQATSGSPASDPAVDMVGQGRMDYATATARYSPIARQAFDQALNAKYPEYQQQNYGVEKKVQEKYTSGNAADQLNAINTARKHMQTFSRLADALDNGNVQLLNKLGNEFGVQFGNDKATNFRIAQQAFGGEVGKAFDGAGVTAGEREDAASKYNDAMSKGQFKGAVKIVDELLQGKQSTLKESYEAGKQGKPNFGNDVIYARDPQGKLHSAKAGTALPAGWTQEKAPQ